MPKSNDRDDVLDDAWAALDEGNPEQSLRLIKRLDADDPERALLEAASLTTQINVPGDTFIDDDFAFATRDGLIVTLEKNVPPAGYESLGILAPFTRSKFNFVLQKAANADEALPLTRMERVAPAAG